MTPIAVILAAALGVGQVPTQEPQFFGTGPFGTPVPLTPVVAQAKGQTGAEKHAPCCNKDCPCPFACMGRKTSDDDYAWLNDALDTLSDTAELLSDVVSAIWPFQTWDGGMTIPCPHYLEHPPLDPAPSPPFPLVQDAPGLVTMHYQVEEQPPAHVGRIIIQSGTVRAESNVLPTPVPVAPTTVAWQVQAPQTLLCPPPGVSYQTPPLPGSYGPLLPMPLLPPLPYATAYNTQGLAVNVAPEAKTILKIVPKGDHHVLAVNQGESTLLCKKTTIAVAGQDLTFAAGPSRVHVHGRSFEASATKVTTQADSTLLLEGDVHLNCDDHGKAMVYKGSKAVVELKGDQVNLVVEKH